MNMSMSVNMSISVSMDMSISMSMDVSMNRSVCVGRERTAIGVGCGRELPAGWKTEPGRNAYVAATGKDDAKSVGRKNAAED